MLGDRSQYWVCHLLFLIAWYLGEEQKIEWTVQNICSAEAELLSLLIEQA